MKKRRKAQPTPKGAAARSLAHARTLLAELERSARPDEGEMFFNRFNDFLRTTRTVLEFLCKEPRGSSTRVYSIKYRGVLFMEAWVKDAMANLTLSERAGYDFLTELREVSTHDFTVKPDRGDILVEVSDSITAKGSFERDVHDPKTHKVIAHECIFAPPDTESTLQSTRVVTRYFFNAWPNEDVITFCTSVLSTLDGLVATAYQQHP